MEDSPNLSAQFHTFKEANAFYAIGKTLEQKLIAALTSDPDARMVCIAFNTEDLRQIIAILLSSSRRKYKTLEGSPFAQAHRRP